MPPYTPWGRRSCFCIQPVAEIVSIPRQILHQEVAVRLRQRIVEGHLAPGAKLLPAKLAL